MSAGAGGQHPPVDTDAKAARFEDGSLRDAPRAGLPGTGGRLIAGQVQNRLLGVDVRIIDAHAEQKTVELRLRQRVGTLLFDRVLGRHDQKQRRQCVGRPPHRHLALAHRLEQCRLHLGWRAVDLVGQ
jgi:hypothetical protein